MGLTGPLFWSQLQIYVSLLWHSSPLQNQKTHELKTTSLVVFPKKILQHHILTWTPPHISTHKIKTISVMLSRLDGLQPGVNFFSLEHAHTVSGETWGSVGCLGWARRCSSYRSRDASGRDWQDCLGAGHDWFAWSADSKPHPLMASSLDRSAGFPGWLAQGQTQPPSPAASWKSSGPHPAGWCNPFLFALRETEMGKVNLQPQYWTYSVA